MTEKHISESGSVPEQTILNFADWVAENNNSTSNSAVFNGKIIARMPDFGSCSTVLKRPSATANLSLYKSVLSVFYGDAETETRTRKLWHALSPFRRRILAAGLTLFVLGSGLCFFLQPETPEKQDFADEHREVHEIHAAMSEAGLIPDTESDTIVSGRYADEQTAGAVIVNTAALPPMPVVPIAAVPPVPVSPAAPVDDKTNTNAESAAAGSSTSAAAPSPWGRASSNPYSPWDVAVKPEVPAAGNGATESSAAGRTPNPDRPDMVAMNPMSPLQPSGAVPPAVMPPAPPAYEIARTNSRINYPQPPATPENRYPSAESLSTPMHGHLNHIVNNGAAGTVNGGIAPAVSFPNTPYPNAPRTVNYGIAGSNPYPAQPPYAGNANAGNVYTETANAGTYGMHGTYNQYQTQTPPAYPPQPAGTPIPAGPSTLPVSREYYSAPPQPDPYHGVAAPRYPIY